PRGASREAWRAADDATLNARARRISRLLCRYGQAWDIVFVPGEKPMPPMTERVIARGPVKSRWRQAINREIDAFRAAIDRSGSKVEEAFIAVLAPGWLDHFIFNEYYNTDEEFLFALAEAVREEYRAVVSAGFVLQIDDPGLPDW